MAMSILFEPGKDSFGIPKPVLAQQRNSVAQHQKPVAQQGKRVADVAQHVAAGVDAQAVKELQEKVAALADMAVSLLGLVKDMDRRLLAVESGKVERAKAPSAKGKSRAEYFRKLRAEKKAKEQTHVVAE